MSELKSMSSSYRDLVEALLGWRADTKMFGHKIAWPEGTHSPDDIFRRLQDSVGGIESSYRSILRHTSSCEWSRAMHPEKEDVMDQDFLLTQFESIRHESKKMAEAVVDGTDSMLENAPEDYLLVASWHSVCEEVENFVRNGVMFLAQWRPDPEVAGVDGALLQAIRALVDAGTDAMRSRKRICKQE
jgi:hypothetical protein